jgi:hypothetical protein
MILNEFKRVKHGEQPGDLSRQTKIKMREGRTPFRVFPWQLINNNCAKEFRKYLIQKSRTVQRRRDKNACKGEL